MLPFDTGITMPDTDDRKRLERFYKRFCEGDHRRWYGLGHMIYACHAAFPLVLSPELANMLWLNFRNYYYKDQLRTINAVAAADFLASPLCRQVAYNQYEVVPEIRNYLLHLLQDSNWFAFHGIGHFGFERIEKLADFLQQYVRYKNRAGTGQHAFNQANEWAALAYTAPETLAGHIASALKKTIDNKNEHGQLRLNMLMERFRTQYDATILHPGTEQEITPFINLYKYSAARKAALFQKGGSVVYDLFDRIRDEYISSGIEEGQDMITLPIQRSMGEKLDKKKRKVQQVYALVVGIDTYKAEGISALKGCVSDAMMIRGLFTRLEEQGTHVIDVQMLLNEEATLNNILEHLENRYAAANPEDIVVFFFAGHGENSNYASNHLICYDTERGDKSLLLSLSDALFKDFTNKVNRNKCHTVVLLDSHTGYYNWTNEGDIFLGAVRHTTQSEYIKNGKVVSFFAEALELLITKTRGRISYRDLLHFMRTDAVNNTVLSGQELPVLMGLHPDRYFLSNEVCENNSHLLLYNEEHKMWEIVQENFREIPVHVTAHVYPYNSINDGNIAHGVTFFEQGKYFLESSSILPDKEQLYNIRFDRSPFNLHVLMNNHITPKTTGLQSVLEKGIKEMPSLRFHSWEKISSFVFKQGPYTVNVMPIIKSDMRGYEYKVFSGDKSFSSGKALTAIQKAMKFSYVTNITSSDNTRLITSVAYAGSITDLSSDRRDGLIKITEDFFRIEGARIACYPLTFDMMNNEAFPVYPDIYLCLPDLSIIRLSKYGQHIMPEQRRTFEVDITPHLDKIYTAEGMQFIFKVLISRDIILHDFSQTGINEVL